MNFSYFFQTIFVYSNITNWSKINKNARNSTAVTELAFHKVLIDSTKLQGYHSVYSTLATQYWIIQMHYNICRCIKQIANKTNFMVYGLALYEDTIIVKGK